LKHFARISGLQCNLEKTSAIPIGGNYDINDKLCHELALNWGKKSTLLGFQIDNRLKELNDNYENYYKKGSRNNYRHTTGYHFKAELP